MNSLREYFFQLPPILIAAFFCIVILVFNWVGYKFKRGVLKRNPERELNLGAAEGSLMGLMALLLAFTFNMVSTKFETRRQTIIEEANILNTAILRQDLYPDSIKRSLSPDFKNYLQSRINYFNAGEDPARIRTCLDETNKYFNSIWNKNAVLLDNQFVKSRAEQLVPVLINMKNIVRTRESGRTAVVPTLILLVLLLLIFVASFLTGLGVKPGHRNPVFSFAFAFMTAVVLFLIMELGRPRQGYINLETAELQIVQLKDMLAN